MADEIGFYKRLIERSDGNWQLAIYDHNDFQCGSYEVFGSRKDGLNSHEYRELNIPHHPGGDLLLSADEVVRMINFDRECRPFM